jgi:hypothetical protein
VPCRFVLWVVLHREPASVGMVLARDRDDRTAHRHEAGRKVDVLDSHLSAGTSAVPSRGRGVDRRARSPRPPATLRPRPPSVRRSRPTLRAHGDRGSTRCTAACRPCLAASARIPRHHLPRPHFDRRLRSTRSYAMDVVDAMDNLPAPLTSSLCQNRQIGQH